MEYLETCIQDDSCTSNNVQLAAKLQQERAVTLSSDRLRQLLKKGYRWKRTRQSHRYKQDPLQKALKQADLKTLELAAQDGHLDLKYLDEAGFCLWSPVSYRYSPVGEQKRLEQTPQRHGHRTSILGVWQPGQRFEYALTQGGFESERYLEVMEWIAIRLKDNGINSKAMKLPDKCLTMSMTWQWRLWMAWKIGVKLGTSTGAFYI